MTNNKLLNLLGVSTYWLFEIIPYVPKETLEGVGVDLNWLVEELKSIDVKNKPISNRQAIHQELKEMFEIRNGLQ